MQDFTYNDCYTKLSNGFCARTFRWNMTAIIPSNAKTLSGYLLQKIERTTEASKAFWSDRNENGENFNVSYFEAWKVNNGKVCFPRDMICDHDDCWMTVTSHKDLYQLGTFSFDEWMLSEYIERYGTKGKHIQAGNVYWIGEDQTDLIDCVKKELQPRKISSARELLSAQTITFEEKLGIPLTHLMQSEWDLECKALFLDEVKRYIASKEICFDIIRKKVYRNQNIIDCICNCC